MKARNCMTGRFVSSLTILLVGLMSSADGGAKFSIDDHATQISKIVEDMAHSIKGIELTMHPSYFNYLVPFTTRVTCTDGAMDISGMEYTHVGNSYMEAINETHSYIQVRFAVADLSYKYDFCWLNVGVPVPIWLRGKVLHSHYFISFILHYQPKCRVDIQRAQLLSYGKLTVNTFEWMPGVIGNWLLEAVTRNAQDQIFATVEMSIQKNTEAMLEAYNPCIVFPSMGKMAPHIPSQEKEAVDPKEEWLEDSRYIGGLLDDIDETAETQHNNENATENGNGIEKPENIAEIEKIGSIAEIEKTENPAETENIENIAGTDRSGDIAETEKIENVSENNKTEL